MSQGELLSLSEGCNLAPSQDEASYAPPLRAGTIGLDTSHSTAFTRALNADEKSPELTAKMPKNDRGPAAIIVLCTIA